MTDLPPGSRVGPWVIDVPIGQGATAVVYRARKGKRGPWRALKVLDPAPAEGSAAAARLAREVASTRTLRHPGLARPIEMVRDGDLIALVSELVVGVSLEQRIGAVRSSGGGGLGTGDVHRITHDVAVSLAHLHSRALLHRDLKPSNVMVQPDGTARLVDFGLVRPADELTIVTSQGQRKASLAYASPEVLLGGDVGPAADLYALGVTLFEALSGRLPFRASNPVHLVLAHIQKAAPPVDADRPELSPWWNRVVQKLLAKRPEERYESAQALADDLTQLKDDLIAGGKAPGAGR